MTDAGWRIPSWPSAVEMICGGRSELGHLQAEVLIGRLLGLHLRRQAVQGELPLGQHDVQVDQTERHRQDQPGRGERQDSGPAPALGRARRSGAGTTRR